MITGTVYDRYNEPLKEVKQQEVSYEHNSREFSDDSWGWDSTKPFSMDSSEHEWLLDESNNRWELELGKIEEEEEENVKRNYEFLRNFSIVKSFK